MSSNRMSGDTVVPPPGAGQDPIMAEKKLPSVGEDVQTFEQSGKKEKAGGGVETFESAAPLKPTKSKREMYEKNEGIWGNEDESDIKYATMEWWQVAVIMIAETVSLGILSIPSVFAAVGMPAGIILIAGIGAIATYTGYVIGQFKARYTWVHNLADSGEVMAGQFGRWVLGIGQMAYLSAARVFADLTRPTDHRFEVCICGSHVLTGTIALNTISKDATCVIVWAVIIAVVGCVGTMPRTLGKISYLAIGSFISIMASILITMIGVGIEGHTGTISVTAHGPYKTAFLSVSDIIFAYAGHAAFFTFIGEMKNPKDYPKALYTLQFVDTSLYIIVGTVVYAYVGQNAKSPALSNTGETLSRVAYGVALPTIIVAGIINGHVAAKLAFVQIFRKRDGTISRHMGSNTVLGWTVWLAICTIIWVIAFILAEVIPFFNTFLALVSSLFAAWFTFGLSGIFWLYLNWHESWTATRKMRFLAVLNIFIVFMGAYICVSGCYASIASIIDGYSDGSFGGPFSCSVPPTSS